MNIALNLPRGMSQNLVMVCKYGRFSRFFHCLCNFYSEIPSCWIFALYLCVELTQKLQSINRMKVFHLKFDKEADGRYPERINLYFNNN